MSMRVPLEYPFGFMFRDDLGAVLAFVWIWGFFCLALGITLYVFHALGLYTMAKRRELSHPWLAWIPFGSGWILGSLSDQYQYVVWGKVQNRRRVLLGLEIAVSACCVVVMCMGVRLAIWQGEYSRYGRFAHESAMESTLLLFTLFLLATMVVAVVYGVFRYICLYNLYRSCNPANATAFLVLSIFISATEPFLIFASRNQEYGMPPRRGQVPPTGYGYGPGYQPYQPPQWQQLDSDHREPPMNP